jgi:hypothetical protein
MEPRRAQIKITDPKQVTLRIWIARLLIGVITAFSLQAAFSFILAPEKFTYAYELSGAAGEAAVRGAGILFLMWNVPYLFALQDPIRYRLALYFAVLAQLIGLLGGVYLFSTLAAELEILSSTILRFIVFSGVGLALALIAYFLIRDALPYQYGQNMGINGRLNMRQ